MHTHFLLGFSKKSSSLFLKVCVCIFPTDHHCTGCLIVLFLFAAIEHSKSSHIQFRRFEETEIVSLRESFVERMHSYPQIQLWSHFAEVTRTHHFDLDFSDFRSSRNFRLQIWSFKIWTRTASFARLPCAALLNHYAERTHCLFCNQTFVVAQNEFFQAKKTVRCDW